MAGCGTHSGTTNTNSSQPPAAARTVHKTMIVGGTPYQGKDNLAKFVKAAAQNPSSVSAQVSAGISSFDNMDYQAAVSYYKKAIQISPKDVIPYNNLGNTYLRGLNQPAQALTYYQKATQVNPSYGFGWLNLAICQAALGNTAASKATAQLGLTKVSKKDKAYIGLQYLVKNTK